MGNGDMEAEKRRSGETIVEQRGGEWGRESHVLFETVIIMSYIYMLIHRRKIKSSVGGRIQRDTCFYFFLDKLLRMKLLWILVTFYSLYAYIWLSEKHSHCHLKRIHRYKLCQ